VRNRISDLGPPMTETKRMANRARTSWLTGVLSGLLAAGCGGGGAASPVDAAAGDLADCRGNNTCTCTSDADCGSATPRCEVGRRRCVACLKQKDNCPMGQVCTAMNDNWA